MRDILVSRQEGINTRLCHCFTRPASSSPCPVIRHMEDMEDNHSSTHPSLTTTRRNRWLFRMFLDADGIRRPQGYGPPPHQAGYGYQQPPPPQNSYQFSQVSSDCALCRARNINICSLLHSNMADITGHRKIQVHTADQV